MSIASVLVVSPAATTGLFGFQDSSAQTPQTGSPSAEPPERPTDPGGIWLSPKLMDLMLARRAAAISRKYDLNDKQQAELRDTAVSTWSKFLRENSTTVQPVINELIEMRLGLEPPDKERVQAWARRAGPLFEQFRTQLQKSTEEFREMLNPQQRIKFEMDALQLRVGLQWAEQKLKQWREGDVDPNDLWDAPGADRRQRQAERQRRWEERRQAAASSAAGEKASNGPKDQVLLELQLWDQYVAAFARLYRLDEAQRDAVTSVLSEMKDRALAHRDNHRNEIIQLEAKISASSGSDEELELLRKELTDLYGPIDEMFQELKRRIEPVPSAAQRAAAAQQAE